MPRPKNFDRTEVLERAKNLFWKQGFHATSMQNLVDHLGINRASLYSEFGGKNKLYETAFTAYRKEGLEYLQYKLNEGDSVRSAIKNLFLESLISKCDDPEKKGCFVVNCTTEYLPKHQHILSDLLEQKEDFEAIFSKVLRRGKASGELPKTLNIRKTTSYLYTFFTGVNVIAKINQDPKELKQSVEIGLQVLE